MKIQHRLSTGLVIITGILIVVLSIIFALLQSE